MTINREQIEEIKKQVHIKWLEKSKTAVINGSEMTVLPYGYLSQAVGEVLENYQPKTTSTDIEELKKEFIESFGVEIANGEDRGKRTIGNSWSRTNGSPQDIWSFFLPRLSNKSEVKKEAVCRVCGMETSTVYNINLKATHICNKCGRSIAKQELDSMFYLSSDEKNSEEGK